eukprot:gene1343-1696_t
MSRLERLLTLLDTGSNPSIRRAAAQQIGEIQKIYPYDLQALLEKVQGYLTSMEWDTRIAAGQAIENIALNVPIWEPTGTSTDNDDQQQSSSTTTTTTSSITEFDLQFDTFDINKVINNGAPLLASGGQEFDLGEIDPNSDPKEQLLKQKKLLRKRLGLDGFGGGQEDDLELFDDDDLIVNTKQQLKRKREDESKEKEKKDIATVLDTSGMSARERNRAKRKAKTTAKEKEASTSSATSTKQPQNSDKIVIESVLDVDKAYNQDEWPFTSLYNDFVIDLFNPVWEIRHGAAVGIREICKRHGQGAGKTINTPSNQMEYVNSKWLEDASLRLLCVIALDRFGDYGSDLTVAPVRETCAQTLSMVVRWMNKESVLKVLDILLQLQNNRQWEVRHGGFLGIKYLVAVRLDLVDLILPKVLPAITFGLMDNDDDVRSTASESFHPVSRQLVKNHIEKLPEILTILWDILLELDDLAVSTSSVLNLLADFYSFPEVLPQHGGDSESTTSSTIVQNQQQQQQQIPANPHVQQSRLAHLVPRLYPFFRHNLYSVRLSSIRTVERLIVSSPEESRTHWLLSILPVLLRYIFQNILLEEREDIIEISLSTWMNLVRGLKPNVIRGASLQFIDQWIQLLSTPPNTQYNPLLLLETPQCTTRMDMAASTSAVPTNPVAETGGKKKGGKKAQAAAAAAAQQQQQQQQQRQRLQNANGGSRSNDSTLCLRSKIIGCKAIGVLFRLWPVEHNTEIQEMIIRLLSSQSGIQMHLACLVLSEGYYSAPQFSSQPMFPLNPGIVSYLTDQIENHQDDTGNYYSEASSIIRSKLVADSKVLASSLQNVGVDFSGVELLGLWTATEVPYEQIIPYSYNLVTTVYDFCVGYIRQLGDSSVVDPIVDQLDSRKKTILVTLGFIEKIQKEYQIQVFSGFNDLLISSQSIPPPPYKIGPIIRSLLRSIRHEEQGLYQDRAAKSLAHFIELCVNRSPCPNDKVLTSMFSVLCEDRTETPSVVPLTNGASNNNVKSSSQIKVKTEKEALLIDHLETTDQEELMLQQQKLQSTSLDDEIRAQILGRKGAISFFGHLCNRFSDRLFNEIPSLFTMMTQTIDTIYRTKSESNNSISYPTDPEILQRSVDELQLIRIILPSLHQVFYPRIVEMIPAIFNLIRIPCHQLQTMASKCIARLCQILTLPTMHHLIQHLLPLLGDTKSLSNRMGAISTVSQIIKEMDMKILPYVVFLTIPILGCMSDQDIDQRRVATMCFAKLVKLMPLEKGVENPEGLDPSLVLQKQEERKFLEQLLDGSKVETYPMPIRINTELRKYQQEGVNWLAFLNKYKLHGILCDDMGLGKTLQAICIMAGDDYHRRVAFAERGTADVQPLPSLVVCPPSLVGHWFYEIKKFCDESMRPMTYMGNPAERAEKRSQFDKHNVLIMSYDILRNDIDILSEYHFNYCILDEGHIIKNAKTKLTQAAKRIHSNHRVILSGTPIQNNVLELWSLFDFLMPGFLGSEKQFNELYSKPILASRDSKCSQKDQEGGVLAMEALHRQVLPFLLRRLKEDVLADLPPKIIQDRYCSLSPLQVRLYDIFSKTNFKESISDQVEGEEVEEEEETTSKSKSKSTSTHIFQALQYLRKLCSHPAFVLNDQHPQFAPIMKEFKLSSIAEVKDYSQSPKLVSLRELLLECGIGVSSGGQANGSSSAANNDPLSGGVTNQHRVLIFSQMKQMLDVVENELFKKHMPSITYLRMDGTTEAMRRHSIVNQFNSDPTIDVLLLTTHVGGLGLNLTGADTVIFLEHDWNPMKDLQAMDRAHRIGQKKVVNVYRLITSGTLEEKIMGLQKFKLNIANTVINQENTSLQTMSTNQLLNLFDYSTENATSGKDSNGKNNPFDTDSILGGDVDKPASAAGGKLKNVLESLGELWDESQYTEEFNLSNFMEQL